MSKRNPDALQIITANRLRDGKVIYLQIRGERHDWCEDIALASATGADSVAALLARLAVDVKENRIVDPYAIAVSAGLVPLTQREAVRAGGPTIAYAS